MITKTIEQHREALLCIIEESGQFDEDGLAHVNHTLDEHFKDPEQAIWLTAIDNEPIGVAYCAPEPMTSGSWNLLMLWVKESYEDNGVGNALVSEVESQLKERHARLLIVETSQLPDFEAARNFYQKYGFTLEAEVKDFFEAGDNKLIYTKAVKP
ncbi:GNAT family N-acetyltransferase [Paraglaciecola sp.]|uniref:GNAT family N-acetyltransferase n=1 Tax=Paraglaciecola sp. TaxID=1920173 RepID=UPI003EF78728